MQYFCISIKLIFQEHLGQIEKCKWRTKINKNKFTQVTFTLRRTPIDCPQITLNNKAIPVKDETKYLGVVINRRLTWDPHLKEKRKSAN